MTWTEFWESFVTEHKLKNKVRIIDEVFEEKGKQSRIEEICHGIYDDYAAWRKDCEQIKSEFLSLVETFNGVHLHTERIKSLDSLLEKVINKQADWAADDNNKYAVLNEQNYKDILTDIIGIRLILNYRGKWVNIHNCMLNHFEMNDSWDYDEGRPLPHIPGKNMIAERPKVYYAEGDDVSQYQKRGLITKRHKKGYRSIHYIVSYQGMYIELQVRTIYDEAWSDCDHNYVYKQENHKSHLALKELSGILSKLTNLSNDIGDQMKEIFDSKTLSPRDGFYVTSKRNMEEFNKFVSRIETIESDLKSFREKLKMDKEED